MSDNLLKLGNMFAFRKLLVLLYTFIKKIDQTLILYCPTNSFNLILISALNYTYINPTDLFCVCISIE